MKVAGLKNLARNTRKECGIQRLTSQNLKNWIQAQGYSVIEFFPLALDDDLEIISSKLGLTDYFSSQQGFTVVNTECRFVFLRAALSEEEKLVVLAHEAGHIICRHMENSPVLGRTVMEEDEANRFAFYLLHPPLSEKINISLQNRKVEIVVFLLCVITVLCAGLLITRLQMKTALHPPYYVTSDGEKYHERDCMIIKNKKNVRMISEEELDSGKYEACQICRPQEK